MQTINISLKAFDTVYLTKAISEIGKILFYIDHSALDRLPAKVEYLPVTEKKTITLKNLSLSGEMQNKIRARTAFTEQTAQKKKTNNTLLNFGFFSFPKTKTIYTVIRSPHIDKKSREQFEFKKYKKKIKVTSPNLSQVSLLLFFLKNSKFTGVELNFSVEYSTFFKY